MLLGANILFVFFPSILCCVEATLQLLYCHFDDLSLISYSSAVFSPSPLFTPSFFRYVSSRSIHLNFVTDLEILVFHFFTHCLVFSTLSLALYLHSFSERLKVSCLKQSATTLPQAAATVDTFLRISLLCFLP